jgi:hypothetical protein
VKWHDLIWLIGTLLGAGALMAGFACGLRNSVAGFFGFAMRSSELAFPHFALVPSDWWGRLVDRLRGNVALQGRYRAIGEDPRVTERFDERHFPLLNGQTCLEAGEGFLLLYRRNRVVAPENVDELVRTGLGICSKLSGRMSDVQSPVLCI